MSILLFFLDFINLIVFFFRKTIELYVYELNEEAKNNPTWEMVGEDLMVALLEPNTIQLIDDSDQTEIGSMLV